MESIKELSDLLLILRQHLGVRKFANKWSLLLDNKSGFVKLGVWIKDY